MDDKTITTSSIFDIKDKETINLNVYGTKGGEGASILLVSYAIKLTP